MPEFTYRGLKPDGSTVNGQVSARDRSDAVRRLAQSGVQAFEVNESGSKQAEAAAQAEKKAAEKASRSASASQAKAGTASDTAKGGSGGRVRLTSSQVIFFTEELSDLLAAGVQLEPALRLMESRGESGPLREVTTRIRSLVREGVPLSRALGQASPSFGPLYCNLVAAGEAGGALEDILRRQVTYLQTLSELRGKVLTAMIYPAFLFLAGVGVTILFISFLVPRLTTMIESSGRPVPPGAKVLIAATAFLRDWWWLLGILVALVVAGFFIAIRHPAIRPSWDRVKLRLPLFGNLQLRRFHVQFLETLSNLLANGLSLIKGLELSRGSTDNLHLQQQLIQVTAQVADGGSLCRALEKAGVFPQSLIDMVRIGEQTGRLGESLAKAGERLDRDLNRAVERLSAFVQPVIMVLMAIVVGSMAYLMITVIYDTISLLRQQ
ncbi:MAG: type II secretion system F family protein [Verrucomicrobiales bacterium]|nr:type II secretion system F family protein [Verrucomicrobiales bacterium]